MLLVGLVALVAGLGDLVGGYLLLLAPWTARRLEQVVGFGAGFFLGSILLHLLPEALRQDRLALLSMTITFLILTLLGRRGAGTTAATVGLTLHALLDGAALGAGFRAGGSLGLLLFLSLFLHKVPEGLALAAILLTAGQRRRAVLWGGALLGAATVLGAFLVHGLPINLGVCLSLAAGSFLYVACTHLLPPVMRGSPHGRRAFLVGLGLVCLLSLLLATGH